MEFQSIGMYIKTRDNNGVLTKFNLIRNLSFAPEADITGQSLPINEFYADIYTQADIPVAQYAFLYDENDNLWAKYWIIVSERISDEAVTIQAQSILSRMERRWRKAKMYNNASLATVMSDLTSSSAYEVSSAFDNVTITGYFPRQNAKERLQMICYTIGAYVKTFFTDKIEILPIDNTTSTVPTRNIYWRPSITHKDYVGSITITEFTFTQRAKENIQNTEEYVVADGVYYVVERTEIELINEDIPENIYAEEIVLSDVYTVNHSNSSAILNRLARVYFKPYIVDAEIINNGEYEPGQKIKVTIDPPDEDTGREAVGYIDSCNFSFGLQAKSKIRLTVQEFLQTTKLIVNYMYGNMKIGSNRYYFPVDYNYSITNPYIDITSGRHRYVYYPKNERATGTISAGVNINNQPYNIALHYYGDTNVLEIISVADVKWQNEDNKEVMVIE